MAKKSKRGSGPRPGSNRAERVAARKERQRAAMAPPPRPFAGLAAECDLVAMRAFVASATVELGSEALTQGTDRSVLLASILPGAVRAIVRNTDDGPQGVVALQTEVDPDDVDREIADALVWATQAAPDTDFVPSDEPPALTDVLAPQTQLDIVVHDDFGWWFPPGTDVPAEFADMLEQAKDSIMPSARLTAKSGIGAPWWVDAGERAHLRWVRPEPEDEVMNALARLHAAGRLTLGEGSRFAGSFRTHGLLVPVFDLDNELHHEEWAPALDQFDEWLTEALAVEGDLTTAEVRSRDGIRGRQVTLR
ncbi:DUF5926 family protein [Gordonia aquimaris]|uniref:DUF5926 family protein n=1 Tax=Gordonia aquimaris TaxID=2984863 RepID=A0A9X3D8V9_9ACTN|nr:DUF5926 family protein [Gordonia aquimaris]MCX2966906.1 DUF5926 family protein [Gordonia aquimaris]